MITPETGETWIKSAGKLEIDQKNGRICVSLNHDFCNYYLWFICREFKILPSTPRFGGHVTVALEKIHGELPYNLARTWAGKYVDFEYNPDIIVGGGKKGHTNFWIKVRSAKIKQLKKDLGIKDTPGYLGLHCTLANDKSNKNTKWQPKMIEIR
jgi:hypothetical protein